MRVTRTQGYVASSDIADPVFREMRGSLESQRAIGCMIGANKVRAEFVWRESRDQWRRLKKIQLFWE
jgi:hypothetical protein